MKWVSKNSTNLVLSFSITQYAVTQNHYNQRVARKNKQKGVAEEVVCMFAERTRRRCHPTSLCGPSPRVRICPRWASLAWIGGPRTRTRLTSRVGCCVHLPAPSKYCQQSSKIERQAVGTSLEGAKSVSKRRSLKRQKTHIQPTDVAVTSAGERLKLAEMFQETQ